MDASNPDVGGEALTGSYPKFNRNPHIPEAGSRFGGLTPRLPFGRLLNTE